jgi:4-hydroxy-2-oxoheptanedioate aldolase
LSDKSYGLTCDQKETTSREHLMNIPQNRFKDGLRQGRVQIGVWAQLVSDAATEILAGSGFDFVVIDIEHAPNDVGTVLPQLRIVDAGGSSAVVRIPVNDLVTFKRFLDIGAQTILVPFVQTAEEARKAAMAVLYPPEGLRGAAGRHRSNRYGRVEGYFTRANGQMSVLVQIETRAGLDNIAEIAAVDGIDALFFGPMDLSASLGYLGNPAHPAVIAEIETGLAAAKAAGKSAGVLAPNDDLAAHFIDIGFDFVSVGGDLAILATGADAIARRFAGARGRGAGMVAQA